MSLPPPRTGIGPPARLLTGVQIRQNRGSRPAAARRCLGTPRAGQDRPWGRDSAGVPAVPRAAPERSAGDAGGWTGPDSPRTFAASRGPGIGRGCWRHVTSWAAACLCCLRSVAAGCLSVPPRLSAVGNTAGHQPLASPAPGLATSAAPGGGPDLGTVPLPCAWPCLPLRTPWTLRSPTSGQHSAGLPAARRVGGMPEENAACEEVENTQPGESAIGPA